MSGGTATWQSSSGSLSGAWTVPGHWKPAGVPDATSTALIGVGVTVNSNWSVSVGNATVGALMVDMAEPAGSGIGTLLAGGTLDVLTGLTMQSGIISDSGTLIAGTVFQGGANGGGTIALGVGAALTADSFTITSGALQAAAGADLDVNGTASLALGTIALTGATLRAATLFDASQLSMTGGVGRATQLLSVGVDATTLDPTVVPSPGSLTLSGGASFAATSLDILDGSTISIDPGSNLTAGGAAPVAGALAVAAGNTVIAPSGTLFGNLALAGVLTTSPAFLGVADFGGEMFIDGALVGNGTIDLASPSSASQTLEIGNARAFTGTIALDPGNLLILDAAGLPSAHLEMVGATLELRAVVYSPSLVPTYDAASGLLVVGGAVLNVGTTLGGFGFAVSEGADGDAVVTVNSAATWQVASGAASGDWNNTAHWNTGTVPGGADTVVIGPGVTSPGAWVVTATNDSAQNLVLDQGSGTLALGGVFSITNSLELRSGALVVDGSDIIQAGNALIDGTIGAGDQPRVTLADGAVWEASALTLGATGTARMTLSGGTTGVGANLDLTNGLTLGGGTAGVGFLTLSAGSDIAADNLALIDGSTLGVDSTSGVQLGGASVVAGAVILTGDATLSSLGAATVAGGVADGGFVFVQAQAGSDAGLRVTGTLSGNGGIEVQTSLEVATAAKFNGVVLLDPGATLVIDSGGFQPSADVDFGADAAIDLRGLRYNVGNTASFTPLSGKLAVGGTASGTIIVGVGTAFGYGISSFGLAPDGLGGTLITLNPVPTWIANTAGLSGDVTNASHWSPAFPGTTQNAQIGPLVTDTGGTQWDAAIAAGETFSVENLLLATNNLGTLQVSGVLDVSAGLTINQGAVVSVAAHGGAVVGGMATDSVAGALVIDAGGGVTAGTSAAITGPVIDRGNLIVNTDAATGKAGKATIGGALTGAGTVSILNGQLQVGSLAGFTGTVVDDGDLLIASGDGGHATLNIAEGATVDLLGLSFSGATLDYDPTTGLLTLPGATLNVGPGQPDGEFTALADHGGTGTEIINSGPPCFAAGTRLRTEGGEIPAEMVRPGDQLLTVSGRLATVAWVGWASIDLRRHLAPQHAAPVRIAANALAPGVPCRDLLVSPDHAIAIGRNLIPARLLCNGATIRAETGLDEITYVHIELDRHDLLIADGAPAESYLETGNRGLFAGSAGVRALHPDLRFAPSDSTVRALYALHGCAPLHTGGRIARNAHARLRARAEALGWRLTGEPRLGIEGDHPGLSATPFGRDGLHLFLPPGATMLRLISRSFVPDELDPRAGDGRRLGTALGVRLNHKPISAGAYLRGWHEPQPGCPWRWTDGDALLCIRPRAQEVKITLKLMDAGGRYWSAPDPAAIMVGPAASPERRVQ